LTPSGPGNETLEIAVPDLGKVLLSADDSTADFLQGKIAAGDGISVTVTGGPGDETMTIGATGYQLAQVDAFTTGTLTTYTPPANCRALEVWVTAGGGGGRYGDGREGGAGGGAAYVFIEDDINASTWVYTVGTGGGGGTSGAKNGTTGGTSLFRISGSTIYASASGGSGGTTTGAAGGSGTTGDILLAGGDAGSASTGNAVGGNGAGPYGGGISTFTEVSDTARNGKNYGGGGSGSVSATGNGGAGAGGIVVVKAYV
jgi:hypothetical protein